MGKINEVELQFLREKKFKQTIAQVKVGEGEEITYETVTTTLKRSVNIFTALQADDGHWPAEIAGPQFFLPPLVSLSKPSKIFIFLPPSLYVDKNNEIELRIVRFWSLICHFIEIELLLSIK